MVHVPGPTFCFSVQSTRKIRELHLSCTLSCTSAPDDFNTDYRRTVLWRVAVLYVEGGSTVLQRVAVLYVEGESYNSLDNLILQNVILCIGLRPKKKYPHCLNLLVHNIPT